MQFGSGGHRSLATDATAPASPAPKSTGGGGGKKKKEKSHKFAHVGSGKKFGHGAEDRPPPALARETARRLRAAATEKQHLDKDGNILTDDEAMQPVYDMINKGTISAEELKRLRGLYPEDLRGARGEELDALSKELHHAEYAKLLKIPDRLKDKVRLADDDVDYLAITGAVAATAWGDSALKYWSRWRQRIFRHLFIFAPPISLHIWYHVRQMLS